jgi:hypothetical protein
LRARFAGGRFDQHAIPLDVLQDLAAYRALIIEVAKMLYKQHHPKRVRVPKGFGDSFQLALKAVEGGHSAVAVTTRLSPTSTRMQQPLPFEFTEFEEARDLINSVIKNVGSGDGVPANLSAEVIHRFGDFGQRLRADEYVELYARIGDSPDR